MTKTQFQVGDKVFAFLLVPGAPLHARYFSPYVVEKKQNELNYVIVTPDKRKSKQLCHVNMRKLYHERTKVEQCVNAVSSGSATSDTAEELGKLFNLSETTKLSNSDVLRRMDFKLTHLDPSQQSNIERLVRDYSHLFPYIPSRTAMIPHDVEVGDAAPIKQHPCISIKPFQTRIPQQRNQLPP